MRCEWDKVWTMPVTEFFNVLGYRRDKSERERAEIERWKMTH